jgi:hypothetical protein
MVQSTRLWTGRSGVSASPRNFLSSKTSRPAVGLTQLPVQWVPGRFPVGEVDHSPPSNAEVKNEWSSTSSPLYAFMVWTGTTILLSYQSMIYVMWPLIVKSVVK